MNKVESTVRRSHLRRQRILNTPDPFVALHALDASSVNVVIRVWVESGDYWGVYFDINKTIYAPYSMRKASIFSHFRSLRCIRRKTEWATSFNLLAISDYKLRYKCTPLSYCRTLVARNLIVVGNSVIYL